MGNKHRGYVEIVLDKPRHLRYDLNALAEVEDVLGISLFKLQEANFGIKSVRSVIWAGLIHEDPNLKPEQVGSWIDGENLKYAISKMSEALGAALVGLKEKNVQGGQKAEAGTGKQQDSSPSDPSDLNPVSSGA